MTPPFPTITVVIPTRNRQVSLKRTLRSVLAQGVEVSAIVVDDASSDGTAEAIERLGDDRVTVISHDVRAGVAAARNTGLEHTKTEWIAFTDDDDVWSPEMLRKLFEALRRDTSCSWACVGAVLIGADDHVVGVRAAPAPGDVSRRVLAWNIVPGGGSGVVARTSLVREVGAFDPAFASLADWDLYIRLAQESQLASVDEPLLAYRIDASSMSHDVRGLMHEFSLLKAKHARLSQRLGTRPRPDMWLNYLVGQARRAQDERLERRLALQLALTAGGPRARAAAVFAALPRSVRSKLRRRREPDRATEHAWVAQASKWLEESR
jgi:glycosyltransferase involved in cell wall biosynthesis